MANIVIRKPDSYGKTRSVQEENMRKEWGQTMTDVQLDKLKFFEKRKKNIDGSTKNFATGIDIDRMDEADRIEKSDEVISTTGSERYKKNYDSIDWDYNAG